ncbi:MAG: phosphoribosylamine--glycine ligase [Cyanobacteria bacterium QS_8_64_29]|nr:MAG: phosphoribosylamine--glycine ligase [Cyanobacteria bacterium QS_8_64_29]
MKVAVIGSGGREHALAWKLLQSPHIERAFCLPGNGGTARTAGCQNVALAADDFAGIARCVQERGIELAVVGQEGPLAQGLTDYLHERGIPTFGPTQAGAQLEASKAWTKDLLASAGIPTAAAATFTNATAAHDYVRRQGAPLAVKADGLAAGKGVVIATTVAQAQAAIAELFQQGHTALVVEECLQGDELTVMALTDGQTVRPLLPSQDYKRIGEGDTGANTGGMGACAPAPLADGALMARIEQEILQPTVSALRSRGIDYRGVLYAGLMVTPQGEPRVLEFNCRFGDPEIQAVLPLLRSPLDELLLACTERRLAAVPALQWYPQRAVCVVTAAQGYPGAYEKGHAITGLAEAQQAGGVLFHAGTQHTEQGGCVTAGGRVLAVTATGETFERARAQAYAATERIAFAGKYYRRDIGDRLS